MTKKEQFLADIADFMKIEDMSELMVGCVLPNIEGHELIINQRVNVPTKVAYYETAYNDDLQLNNNSEVSIGFVRGWDNADKVWMDGDQARAKLAEIVVEENA